ncbi:MAG: UbiA family prenyltransferase, partial [Candidatus Aenigmarchaeota archaeon]|nr:UbiA family prenyltransferase [Candidatus Aenigmarchaeota archaeon]
MNPYIEITRPNVCALTVLGIIIGALVVGILGFYAELVYAVLAGLLLCAGGNVINDFFDAEIDRVNRPERPIPSGHITPNSALYYYLVLSVIGLALALLV